MDNYFSSNTQNLLANAQSLVLKNEQSLLEPVHMMAAITEDKYLAKKLSAAGANVKQLHVSCMETITSLPSSGSMPGEFSLSRESVRLLNVAQQIVHKKNKS